MSNEKEIRLVVKEVRYNEYIIEVPPLTPKQFNDFLGECLDDLSDVDARWIFSRSIHSGTIECTAFKVCFRSPADFGLENSLIFRLWDLNNALHGNTLESWQVICLCWAISNLESESPLFLGCGSIFHVLSNLFEAGKHRGCYLDIGFSSKSSKPKVWVNTVSSPLYFNPTSYYGVLI